MYINPTTLTVKTANKPTTPSFLFQKNKQGDTPETQSSLTMSSPLSSWLLPAPRPTSASAPSAVLSPPGSVQYNFSDSESDGTVDGLDEDSFAYPDHDGGRGNGAGSEGNSLTLTMETLMSHSLAVRKASDNRCIVVDDDEVQQGEVRRGRGGIFASKDGYGQGN